MKFQSKRLKQNAILPLLIAGTGLILVGIVSVSQIPSLISQAAPTKATVFADTKALITTRDVYLEQAKSKEKVSSRASRKISLSQFIQSAKERYEDMRKNAHINPGVTRKRASLGGIRKTFPSEVQQYIEEDLRVSGTVSKTVIDDLKNKTATYEYSINDGKKSYIILDDQKREYTPGSVVVVEGTRIGGYLLPARVTARNSVNSADDFNSSSVVLLVNFKGKRFTQISEAQVRSLIFEGPDSVTTYFKAVSSGKFAFTGPIHGWFTLDMPLTSCTPDDMASWQIAAREQANAAGINISDPHHIIYLIAENSVCHPSGMSSLGMRTQTVIFEKAFHDRLTYLHEFGHAIGAAHASTLDCPGKSVDDYSRCTTSEYGEINVMGWFYPPYQYHGPHRVSVGLKTAQDVTASGVFTLSRLGTGPEPTVLRFPKANTNEYYYVSYSEAIGYDAGLPLEQTRGVGIHIWDGSMWSNTKRVDATPENPRWPDNTLADGKFFYDAVNRVGVTQISHTATEVKVFVGIDVTWPPIAISDNPIIVGPSSGCAQRGQACRTFIPVTCCPGLTCNFGVNQCQ